MPATGVTQAHASARRIQQSLQTETFEVGGRTAAGEPPLAPIRLLQTVSIGVATWDKRETPEQLENRADAAMYEAKRLGRDRVVVATPHQAT